jgi:opacity protein-like surface antigen
MFGGRILQPSKEHPFMRKFLLLSAAGLAVVASPAFARDGSAYVGIEGGVLLPKDNDADVDVEYTTVNSPTGVVGTPAGPANTTFGEAIALDYKTGYDIDAIGGYDFGMFRLEGELGYKRASLDDLEFDSGFLTSLNTALNRPAGPGDVGTLAPLVDSDFDLDGHVSVLSGMLNGLVDFGNEDGVSFFAGGGFGRARVKLAGESDSAWAWQLLAGLRFAISPNIDLGLKYRYFRTGNLDFVDDTGLAFAGNGNAITVGGTPVVQTTSAVAFADFSQKFSSHSLLASLVFNFGAPAAAPEPVLAPPPPPPAAPATQTCPDGSVILATSSCPVPPPPPPPPAPTERGERGR